MSCPASKGSHAVRTCISISSVNHHILDWDAQRFRANLSQNGFESLAQVSARERYDEGSRRPSSFLSDSLRLQFPFPLP